MPLHAQAQQIIDMFQASGLSPIDECTPEEVRSRAASMRDLTGTGPEVADVTDVVIEGLAGEIALRIYRPEHADGTLVYYHGGGWVVGAIDDYDVLARLLADRTRCSVVLVEYRLAPEHRFPAAADDAYSALCWVAENLADERGVVVAGDSAGGNLAAVVSLRARDEGGPTVPLQVLVYPVTDHDFNTVSYREHGNSGLLLGRGEMIWFWDHYLPDADVRNHPYASPLRAPDLASLPPALVMVAEYDPLRDEGLAYAARLEHAGVPVTIRHYEDQLHGFFTLVNVIDRAHEGIDDVAEATRSVLGRTPALEQ